MSPSHDPSYPLFPTLSFLGFVVSFIPLPWHIQAWNAGTCAFMIWTGTACLNEFVNSIVWRGHVLNLAPVWCDICKSSDSYLLCLPLINRSSATKMMIGVSIGIPASTLCISRRLYSITAIQTVSVTREDVGTPALILVTLEN